MVSKSCTQLSTASIHSPFIRKYLLLQIDQISINKLDLFQTFTDIQHISVSSIHPVALPISNISVSTHSFTSKSLCSDFDELLEVMFQ